MQANGPRLRELLDEEAVGSDDLSPAGAAAVRANLRLVAEGLAATTEPALSRFAEDLPRLFRDRELDLAEQRRVLGEAEAHELEMQFGSGSAEDPSTQAVVVRRIGVQAHIRVFLDLLDEVLGGGVASPALAWMAARREQLANTIVAMDLRAKEIEIARGGPDAVGDALTVNRIGQAAMMQANVRFMVEALAAVGTPATGRSL